MLDWLQGAGLGDIATEFFRKLSIAVNLLCVPRTSLLKVTLDQLCMTLTVESLAQLCVFSLSVTLSHLQLVR